MRKLRFREANCLLKLAEDAVFKLKQPSSTHTLNKLCYIYPPSTGMLIRSQAPFPFSCPMMPPTFWHLGWHQKSHGIEFPLWCKSEKAVGDCWPLTRQDPQDLDKVPPFHLFGFWRPPFSSGPSAILYSASPPPKCPAAFSLVPLSGTDGHRAAGLPNWTGHWEPRVLGRHGWAQACSCGLPNSPLE